MGNHNAQKQADGILASLASFFRKLTIANKLWLSIGLMASLTLASWVVAYVLVQPINADVEQIVDIEGPLEQAILEMEINVGETPRAVLDYTRDLDLKDIEDIPVIALTADAIDNANRGLNLQ